MSLEKIKAEIAEMPKEQQDHLAAYLVHLRHQRDREISAEIRTKIGDTDRAKWLTLDELREEWKD